MNTETTAPTETRTVETAAGPVIAPAPWTNLIKEGPHRATILSVDASKNKNGNPYVGLNCDLATRTHIHQMYLTPGAFANTAEQLKKAFGVDIEAIRVEAVTNGYTEKRFIDEIKKTIQSIQGQKCSLNFKHEEYKGRMQSKVAFVNPDKSTEITEGSLSGLLSKDYQPKPAKAEPTTGTGDVAF